VLSQGSETRHGSLSIAIHILAAVELSPAVVMSIWAAGVATVSGVVIWWRIVGPGFTWLAGGVTLLLGIPAALGTGSAFAWVGCAMAVIAIGSARHPRYAASIGAVAAIGFLVAADGNVVSIISGALFLGGVTAEMMLGHWYLVDPSLPRWALRRLALAGAGGAVVDFVVLASLGLFPWPAGDTAVGLGFMLLAVTTVVLMIAVGGALREEGYAGVMSATGLSYLALLTAIGTAVVGRMLLEGPVLS
jgi:hypothetical protein